MRGDRLSERSGEELCVIGSAERFGVRKQFSVKSFAFLAQGGIFFLCHGEERGEIGLKESPVAGKTAFQEFDGIKVVVADHEPCGG